MLVSEEIPDISSACASPISTRVFWRLVASTVFWSGTVILGDVVSTIVTLCSILDSFPATSVAVHVTIVSPIGKNSGALFVMEISCIS